MNQQMRQMHGLLRGAQEDLGAAGDGDVEYRITRVAAALEKLLAAFKLHADEMSSATDRRNWG